MSAVSFVQPTARYAAPARPVAFGERDYAFAPTSTATISPAVPATLAGLGTGLVMALAGAFRKMPLAAFGATAVAATSLAAYNLASQKQTEQRLDYLA